MQGVIKSYDPGSGDGVVLCDTDFQEYDLAPDALVGSVFRMLRQGQRVIFDLDDRTRATRLPCADTHCAALVSPSNAARRFNCNNGSATSR